MYERAIHNWLKLIDLELPIRILYPLPLYPRLIWGTD
jgi:hypothetical protein